MFSRWDIEKTYIVDVSEIKPRTVSPRSGKNKLVISLLLPRCFLNSLWFLSHHELLSFSAFLYFLRGIQVIEEIGRRSPQGFTLTGDSMDSRQLSSGMTDRADSLYIVGVTYPSMKDRPFGETGP